MANENNPEKSLGFWQRVGLEVLWGISRGMHFMPRWFRYYIFKPFIYGLLLLTRYRLKIVRRNLELCFPERSPKERKRMARQYYKSLAEIIVDTISLAGATPKCDSKRVTWANGEEHLKRVEGKDWIAICAHFGCWEYYLQLSWFDKGSRLIGVYHPLRSPLFECYYLRLRNISERLDLVTMQDTIRFYMRNRGKGTNYTMGLISDQSPRLSVDTEWYDFFGQPTAFIEGGATMAKKFHMPIYFVNVRRRRAGEYEYRFDELYDGVEDIDTHEITQRYATTLEAMIRQTPELWLWSHHRWRYTPEKQEKLRESIKNRQN